MFMNFKVINHIFISRSMSLNPYAIFDTLSCTALFSFFIFYVLSILYYFAGNANTSSI